MSSTIIHNQYYKNQWQNFDCVYNENFSLHYITLRHFKRQLHLQWPMVHQQSHSSSPKCELKKVSFQKFFEGISVCEFLKIGREENSMPSVPRMRNSAHRTLVSTVEVHIGSCWRILVSHDRAGQRRVTSCPTGTQGCDQLAPGAWARRACRFMRNLIGSQCRLWRTGVMWSRVPVPATSLAAAFWTRWSGSIVDCGRPARTELQ